MKIYTVKVGDLRTNCYIVSSDNSKDAIIIDPGASPDRINALIEKEKLNPMLIVNTHAHHDHVGANDILSKKYGIHAALSRADHELMHEWKTVYFYEFEGINMDSYAFKRLLEDGDVVSAGELELKVIETPGHSRGSICLYGEGVLFSGDTLFASDYGRTDFHGGSDDDMKNSLKKLMKLPDDTIVYPGHGKATTIKAERMMLLHV
jgi:hydroxyacylglutathione hydrolase